MAKLSQIAQAVIQLSTASIAKSSFGIPMIIGASTSPAWRDAAGNSAYTLTYTDLAAAVLDNLEQKFIDALQECFMQTPRIERVMIGRLVPQDASFQPDESRLGTDGTFPTGTEFEVTIAGESVRYTSLAGDKVAQVSAGLLTSAKGNATLTADYSFAADTSHAEVIDVTPLKSSMGAPLMSNINGVIVTPGTIKPTDIAEGLTRINSESGIWYGFSVLDRSDEIIMESAKWTESAEPSKQYFAASADPLIWTSSRADILSRLQDKQFLRTQFVAHKKADEEYPETAWMARVYTADPGATIFGLKVLSGITPSDFTPGEQQFIWQKNGNTYEKYEENTYLINKGKTVSGEWSDTVRDRDWLIDYIQKSVASAMIRRNKIPYTNQGIQIIVNVLQGCLRYAQQIGVLAPDERNSMGETVPGFVISFPNAADLSADIKASRQLNISFVGILAGAIQMTKISGVLAYSYGE